MSLHQEGSALPLARWIAYGINDLNCRIRGTVTYKNKIRSRKADIARNHAHTSKPLPALIEACKSNFFKACCLCLFYAEDYHIAGEAWNQSSKQYKTNPEEKPVLIYNVGKSQCASSQTNNDERKYGGICWSWFYLSLYETGRRTGNIKNAFARRHRRSHRRARVLRN